jgi:hypothetical protein
MSDSESDNSAKIRITAARKIARKSKRDRKFEKAVAAAVAEKCGDGPVVKVKKPKRAPSAYNLFVRLHMKDPEIMTQPPKSRMAAIGQLWRLEKEAKKSG